MRRGAPLLLVLLVLPVGCGKGEAGDDPGSLVPPKTSMYAEVILDPEGDQEDAVRSIVERFPGGEDGPGPLIERGLQDLEVNGELTYEDDVEPWLGDRVAFFLSGIADDSPEGGAVIATRDGDKAMDAFEEEVDKNAEKRSYEGVDYLLVEDGGAFGVVEGHAVIATESGFKAVVDAADGNSFEDDEDFRDAVADLPEDRLATFYLDFRKLFSSAGLPQAQIRPLMRFYGEPFTFALVAEDDAVVLDATIPGGLSSFLTPFLGAGSEVVEQLPADSWLAVGQLDVGKQIKSTINLFAGVPEAGFGNIEKALRQETGLGFEELFGWMGDVGLFVRGTSIPELEAGLVIETTDPAASRRAIGILEDILREEAGGGSRVLPLQLAGGGTGYTLTSPEIPAPVHVVQRGDRVVLAYSDAAATALLSPQRTLGDDPEFRAAADRLGEGFLVSAYVRIEPILTLAESLGAGEDEGYKAAKPYLEVFDGLIAGAEAEGEPLVARTRIELR